MKATATEKQVNAFREDVKVLMEKAADLGIPMVLFAASQSIEDENRTAVILAASVNGAKNEAAGFIHPAVKVLEAYAEHKKAPRAALMELGGISPVERLKELLGKMERAEDEGSGLGGLKDLVESLSQNLGKEGGLSEAFDAFLGKDCGNPDCDVHHPESVD